LIHSVVTVSVSSPVSVVVVVVVEIFVFVVVGDSSEMIHIFTVIIVYFFIIIIKATDTIEPGSHRDGRWILLLLSEE